jgi:hypothetical protein
MLNRMTFMTKAANEFSYDSCWAIIILNLYKTPQGWCVDRRARMTVGLSWTRTRVFNPRFGQRVRHRSFARRLESNRHFCPSGLDRFGVFVRRVSEIEHSVLFDELNKMLVFNPMSAQPEKMTYKNLGLGARLVGWMLILWFRVESETVSSVQRVNLWSRPVNPSDELAQEPWPLNWVSEVCPSGRVGLKKSVRTRLNDHTTTS